MNRILIVEDDETIHNMIDELFRKRTISVWTHIRNRGTSDFAAHRSIACTA